MSTRNDILTALKNDIEDYIKSSRSPYKSDVAEVKRGWHKRETIVNFPCVCFTLDPSASDIVEEELFDSQIRMLIIYLYTYTDTDGYGDHSNIHQLIHDIEYFLNNDFSYKDNTYIKDIVIVEGGITEPNSSGDMYINIRYEQKL